MNERIRQLAEQANAFARENVEYSRTEGFEIFTDKLYEVSREKFAELIVRQCMDLVKDCYAEPESGQSPYQTVCASTIIEDHFGVKE